MRTCGCVLARLITPVGQKSVRKGEEAPRAGGTGGLWTGRHPLAQGPHPHWSEVPKLLVEGGWGFAELWEREASSGVQPVILRLGQTSLTADLGHSGYQDYAVEGVAVGSRVSPGPGPLCPSPRHPGRSLLFFPTGSSWWPPTLSVDPGWGHHGGRGVE